MLCRLPRFIILCPDAICHWCRFFERDAMPCLSRRADAYLFFFSCHCYFPPPCLYVCAMRFAVAAIRYWAHAPLFVAVLRCRFCRHAPKMSICDALCSTLLFCYYVDVLPCHFDALRLRHMFVSCLCHMLFAAIFRHVYLFMPYGYFMLAADVAPIFFFCY